MVCASCGKEISAGVAFCPKCCAKQTAPPAGLTPKQQIAQIYLEYLRGEGYAPEINSEGDVQFKFEGGNYYINICLDDREYLRIVYPRFWPVLSEQERVRVREAALHATERTKVGKVYPTGNNVSASFETFCLPPENFKLVFKRSLKVLQYAVKMFADKMRETAPAAPPVKVVASAAGSPAVSSAGKPVGSEVRKSYSPVSPPAATTSETFSIAHDHGPGASCYGQMTIGGGFVRYRSSDKGGHSFDFAVSSIAAAEQEPGVQLIEYHFRIRLTDGKVCNFFSVDGRRTILEAIRRAAGKR